MSPTRPWLRRRLSQRLTAPKSTELAGDLSRYEHGMLRDAAIHHRLVESGVARVSGVVALEVVKALQTLYNEALATYTGPLPNHWFPTGMLPDPELQARVHDGAQRLATPVLESLMNPGRGQVFTGSFAVKPVGPASLLGPHQDVSIVDETQTSSINFWIPLVRSRLDNGALTFVAGSHRFGNVHRSLAMPWAFQGHHESMDRHAQMLEAEVGDIILFDTAMIHGSPANCTDAPRVALQGALVPAGLPMEHLSITPDTPPGMVEVCTTSPLDLLMGDGVKVSTTATRVLRPLVAPTPSLPEFDDWCRREAVHRVG